MDTRLNRQRWRIVFVIAMLMAALIAAGAWVMRARGRPFDSQAWKDAAATQNYSARRPMLADILRRFDAGEWPEATAVRSAFGEPEDGMVGATARCRCGRDRRSLLSFDNDYLQVQFDDNAKVTFHAIVSR